MDAPPSPLSSRAKPRDLQCAPPPTRILRYQIPTPKQRCHPDRSVAKWRDLLFILRSIESEWKRRPPLCHPERSRGICSSADPSWKCVSPLFIRRLFQCFRMQTKAFFASRLLLPGFPACTRRTVFAGEGQACDLAVRDGTFLRGILRKEPDERLTEGCAGPAIEDVAFDHRAVLAVNGDVATVVKGFLECVQHFRIAAQNRRPALEVLVLGSRRQFQRIRIKLRCCGALLPGHTLVSSIWRLASLEICTSDGDEWPFSSGEVSRSRAP